MLKRVQHDGEEVNTDRRDNSRHIRARRGSEIKAKSWTTEAAVRMLMNNLDDEVLRILGDLVVEVVHQHPDRRLGGPVLRLDVASATGAYVA